MNYQTGGAAHVSLNLCTSRFLLTTIINLSDVRPSMVNDWPLVDISDVNPYANNPRINDDAVPFLANSIHDFGFMVPIVIDGDRTIVAGHTRVLACKELLASGDLGYWGDAPDDMSMDDPEYSKYQGIAPCVPFIDASALSPEQVDAFRLIDNKVPEYSGWHLEKLDLCLEPLKVDFDMTRYGFLDLPDDIEVYEGEDNSIQLPDVGVDRGSKVMVMLDSQEQAEALAERLTDEGYRCKVLS